MRVVHLSTTPLVGAPGSVSRALNEAPGVQSRWCVLDPNAGAYGKLSFDLDLVWERDRDLVIELVEQADIVHLHNFIGLGYTGFEPLNFQRMWDCRKPLVRQFHSTPQFIAQTSRMPLADLLACPIPRLVIAQHPERYLSSAFVVPNLPNVVSAPARKRGRGGPIRIGFAPSRFNSGVDSRWDTKGYPETVEMLDRLGREAKRMQIPLEIDVIEQVSHAECLRRKVECDLFIDELVTGSYHLNTLESLALGVVSVSYLDGRTCQQIRKLTGRDDFPVVNVGLEHAQSVLMALAKQPELVDALARAGKLWMDEYWRPAWVAQRFLQAYAEVIAEPHRPFPARFGSDTLGLWHAQTLSDLQWAARRQQWPRRRFSVLRAAKSVLARVVARRRR